MIVASAPLRLSLAGGGTDLPSYYSENGGHLLTLALDARVCVRVEARRRVVVDDLGEISRVDSVAELRPASLVRAALEDFGIDNDVHVEIRSDVPAGTGLGGSGAFLVALGGALAEFRGMTLSGSQLARRAFGIERAAGRPVGHQDHWIAALGGLLRLRITPGGEVYADHEAQLFQDVDALMRSELLLFETPLRRAADTMLRRQADRLRSRADSRAALRKIHALVADVEQALRARSAAEIGRLLEEHWRAKCAANPAVSSAQIQSWHDAALANGATGAKLVGAGGGGFLNVCVPSHARERVQTALVAEGLVRRDFRPETCGLRVTRTTGAPASPIAPDASSHLS